MADVTGQLGELLSGIAGSRSEVIKALGLPFSGVSWPTLLHSLIVLPGLCSCSKTWTLAAPGSHLPARVPSGHTRSFAGLCRRMTLWPRGHSDLWPLPPRPPGQLWPCFCAEAPLSPSLCLRPSFPLPSPMLPAPRAPRLIKPLTVSSWINSEKRRL